MMIWIVLILCLTSITNPKGLHPEAVTYGQPMMFGDAGQASSFALIELFTSQGCSSCPPADALLSTLQEEATVNGQNIYTLSFHVDYWNYLGWKDPYSNPAYSARQRKYARVLATKVYTPMMVINGKHSFVGSDKEQAGKYLHNALASIQQMAITANAAVAQDSIDVQILYDQSKYQDQSPHINIAVVETTTSNPVPHGENRGHTLRHINVVRAFEQIQNCKSGIHKARIPLSADIKLENTRVIVFIQDAESLEVYGATAADLE
jgi:hypothetical protein